MATRRQFLAGSAASAAFVKAGRLAAQAGDPTELSLLEASAGVRRGSLSPVELTQAYLDRIERHQDTLNAYITIIGDEALSQARRLEEELAAGRWRGPLHGIPIALKDNIDTAGLRTTAASALLQDRVPDGDAEIHRRLREAGAVLLGKLNMHEFAYGGTSAISHFGPVRNPWNPEHIPGGSSGGSAAAVAARLCCAALGTDTLASIRQPSAYCGITGLKATHGLTSIRGIIPVSESLDHVGPMCRSAADTALMLQAMAGFDPLDPVSIRAPRRDYLEALYQPTGSLRIGIPGGVFYDNLVPDVGAAVEEALTVLASLTGGRRDVDLPAIPGFSVILAESYAWHQPYLEDPANHSLYDPNTLERLLAAGEVSAADYINVRHEMARARNSIDDVFQNVDVLVTPTTPGLPERIDNAENPSQPSGAESSVRNTAPFNLYGIPTISIPCGFSGTGLPIGLQLSSAHLDEASLLALAHAFQQATDWHLERPSL